MMKQKSNHLGSLYLLDFLIAVISLHVVKRMHPPLASHMCKPLSDGGGPLSAVYSYRANRWGVESS